MKKVCIVVALLCACVSLSADNSQTFMPLVSSPQFLNRSTYLIAQEAAAVLSEVNTTPCHATRVSLAIQAARSPAGLSPIASVFLVSNINVTSAGALTGTLVAGTLDTPATDAALFAALDLSWNAMAGCIVHP